MKTWLPAEDQLLQQLRGRFTWDRIAVRFGCTAPEAHDRARYLLEQKEKEKPAPDPAARELVGGAELEAMKSNMNPLQRAFMDSCEHYNALGQSFSAIAKACEMCLGAEELEAIVKQCLDAPRKEGENVFMKVARELCQRCIVIRLPDERTKIHQD
jgi:hypothetical protein